MGVAAEKKSYSFILVIPVDDPEAESPAYEVKFTANTSFEGTIESFEQLKEGDHVEVWMEESHEEQLGEGIIVASRVIVKHENE